MRRERKKKRKKDAIFSIKKSTHRHVARGAGRDLVERRVTVQQDRGVGCIGERRERERGDGDDERG